MAPNPQSAEVPAPEAVQAADPAPAPPASETAALTYSVVIPVFNSVQLVGQVIDRTVAFFDERSLAFELILVNDGSQDGSWAVLQDRAAKDGRIRAVNLLTNYGQHTAMFCGFQQSKGDYVITLDDDLQNPPEEIEHLIAKAAEGHDLVFGRFHKKRHAFYRRLGSIMVGSLNRRIFGKPKDLVVSNFRCVHRSVVDRMCAYRSIYPYITGLALMYSSDPANVPVEHQARPVGRSQYSLVRILRLVMRILFAYSAFPLRFVSSIGLVVSVLSMALGLFYLVRHFVVEAKVPGWTTLVVLLSFFNGINLMLLGMLGEYLVRLLNQTSASRQYEIKEVVGGDA